MIAILDNMLGVVKANVIEQNDGPFVTKKVDLVGRL
jgi:hypothetical protein